MSADTKTALILLGHGTRDANGQREFQDLVEQVADQLTDTVVRSAYIELQTPDLQTVVRDLHRLGIDEQVVCPILLLAAGHARRDVPTWVTRLRDELPAFRNSRRASETFPERDGLCASGPRRTG